MRGMIGGLLVALLIWVPSSAAEGVLYLDDEVLEEIDGEYTGCVTTPRYAMGASEVEAGKAYFYEVPGAAGRLGCRVYFDHVVDEPMVLGAEVTFTMFFACEATGPGGAPASNFRAMLFKNGEEIDRTTGGGDATTCPDELRQVQFVIPAAHTAFAAGDTLTIGLATWIPNPAPPANDHLYIAVGGDTASRMVGDGLPGSGSSAPDPDLPFARFESLDGDFETRFDTEAASTGTVQYNWTLPAPSVDLELGLTGDGDINFEVLDNGTSIATHDGADGNTSLALEDLTGPVHIVANMTDFNGTIWLSGAAAVEATEPDDGDNQDPTDDGDPEGTAQDDADAADGNATAPKESPGIGVVVLLAALAGLAARRR